MRERWKDVRTYIVLHWKQGNVKDVQRIVTDSKKEANSVAKELKNEGWETSVVPGGLEKRRVR